MKTGTTIFFLMFSKTVVLGAKAQIPTLPREEMFLSLPAPKLLKQGLHRKKKKKSKFKCSLYKSTRVASPVPVAIAISNWNVVIVNTTFSDWIASFISH